MAHLIVLPAAGAVAAGATAFPCQEYPESGLPATVISAVSCTLFSALFLIKRRLASELDFPVLAADAACSFACARLTLVLLVGIVLFRTVPGA